MGFVNRCSKIIARNRFFVLVLAIVLLVIIFHASVVKFVFSRFEQPNNQQPKRRIILLWTKYFDHPDFYFGLGHEIFKNRRCDVTDCEVTRNRKLIDISDAVVFHFQDLSISDLPKRRNFDQRWVFLMGESAANTGMKRLRKLNGVFNWTMTYRLDSDIVNTYGATRKMQGTRATSLQPKSRIQKQRLVAWLVSHCRTAGKREEYVRELNKHVPVDVYGGCSKEESHRDCPEDNCGVDLYRSHKFYLAFENSVCRDYITEKFFKALTHHIVPVVYGGGDYKLLAPPHSYIDVRDFDSPHDLADYLKVLDANDTLYNEYLEWTDEWELLKDWKEQNRFCQLCAALHQQPPNVKVYDNLVEWWAGTGICGTIKY